VRPPPFEPAGEHLGIELPGARALFTTRRGGVSTGPYESLNLGKQTGDEWERVSANRDRLACAAGIPRDRFAQGRQVHGTTVRRLHDPPDSAEEPPAADGQATALSGLAAVVLVADCLPIALAAPGAVAMVHAGWRGLADGVVAEGVRALRELSANGAPVVAAIGPAAGRCCYEVGEEVHARFAAHGPEVRDGRRLDLKAIARAQLEGAGIDDVHDTGICTMCADPALFYSHRRDGGITGRQAGAVWRT
jgi:purine-nucleoside/S-methyl-5'-thioadenosine phosphorylase / adenosine deaminase